MAWETEDAGRPDDQPRAYSKCRRNDRGLSSAPFEAEIDLAPVLRVSVLEVTAAGRTARNEIIGMRFRQGRCS